MKRRMIFIPILFFMLFCFVLVLSRSPVEMMSTWASDEGLMLVKAGENLKETGLFQFGGKAFEIESIPFKYIYIFSSKLLPTIPTLIRNIELISIIILSFGLLFLTMSLKSKTLHITSKTAVLALVMLNPAVLSNALDMNGGPVTFMLLSLIIYLYTQGKNALVWGFFGGFLVWTGLAYAVIPLGLIIFSFWKDPKDFRKFLMALLGFALAVLPMIIFQIFPKKNDFYTGVLYASKTSHFTDQVQNLYVELSRFIDIPYGFWMILMQLILLGLVITSIHIIRKNKKSSISPLLATSLLYFVIAIVGGYSLMPFFVISIYSIVYKLSELKDRPRMYLPSLAILSLLVVIWLIPNKQDISAHLEMGRYIQRAIKNQKIVMFRPGLLSITAGGEFYYPSESTFSPREALATEAQKNDADWGVLVLTEDEAKEIASTYETKAFERFGEKFILSIIPINNLPSTISLQK